MKRILFIMLFCISVGANASTSLQAAVDKLINQVDPSINMGVEIVDLNTGDTLYERNATRPFVPASNMKLFSDAAALMALGPDYRFQTTLATDAKMLEKGVLRGSLYLHMQGDPSFSEQDLDAMLAQLPRWGVKRIEGNVILVSNNSVVAAFAPGRSAADFKYSYGAPIAPVVIDENRLTVTVNPGYRAGADAIVEAADHGANLFIDNQAKTQAKAQNCGVGINLDQDNHLSVRGCVGVGQWAVQQRIAIRNPLRYAQDLVRAHLARLNIKLDGQVMLGQAPASSLLLASHVSKPITELMAATLKPSDNLYADSLFLHAAAKLNGSPLNWPQAEVVVKNFLQQQTGINLQNAVLTDGSGLSRNDLLTPKQTVELLSFLHNRFPLAYEYIAALPVAGHDGTLQKRFRKPNQQGLLRAKTGTMTGVISLSGYLYTANAHTLAFAIFINKTRGTKPAVSWRYRPLVDTICDFLLRQKPNGRQVASSQNPYARVAFQTQPTQADRLRSKYAKWRQLESAIKQALQGQAVAVIYRGDQLVLKDQAANLNSVWAALQTLRKKYVFSVALNSKVAPQRVNQPPLLLWVKTNNQGLQNQRTWTIRESVS